MIGAAHRRIAAMSEWLPGIVRTSHGLAVPDAEIAPILTIRPVVRSTPV
jgi:hypothetical protein